MALYSPVPPKSPEELLRVATVRKWAEAVFGNDFDAAIWLGEHPPMKPGGTWRTHLETAEWSDEGLRETLERLDELAKTVVPRPLDPVIRAARNGRRIRRKKSDFK